MGRPHLLLLTVLSLSMAAGCHAGSELKSGTSKGSISVSLTSKEVRAEGETFEIVVKSNKYWRAACSQNWLRVSPSSGNASEYGRTVKVTVDRNEGGARNATVTFGLNLSPAEAVLNLSQKRADPDGIRTLTVEEFKSIPEGDNQWYRVTAEIMSISKPQYGDMYVSDGTGQLYVYGLAPARGGSDTDFPKLGLGPGDVVTFVARKAVHSSSGGKVIEAKDAYYESHEDGTPLGTISSSASQKWLELPAMKKGDGTVFLTHPRVQGGRNYSICFDRKNRLSKWVCYPYVHGDGGTGRNGSPYSYDPLLDYESQADLTRSFQNRTFGDEEFIRGHMVPSNDRSGRANYDLFFSTNIMPQSSALNSGVWGKLEQKVHNTWSRRCDTLYVVTGTHAGGSSRFVTDNSGKGRKTLVPEGVFKAVLARMSNGTYRALGAYFDNRASTSSDFTRELAISIDELEAKVGIDLFVNLPDDVEASVEAEKPSSVGWWWN